MEPERARFPDPMNPVILPLVGQDGQDRQDGVARVTRLWPEDDFADLVDCIMLAKHGVDGHVHSPAWRSTAGRHVEEIRAGKGEGIAGEVISARIRRIVGR